MVLEDGGSRIFLFLPLVQQSAPPRTGGVCPSGAAGAETSWWVSANRRKITDLKFISN